MIIADISNVWGQIALPDLLNIEKEVSSAHAMLTEKTGPGKEYLAWMELPTKEATKELSRMCKAADRIRESSEVCVVLGVGTPSLGSRAVIELLQGADRNTGRGKTDPQIVYAGDSLSTRRWNALMDRLEGKDFSVAVLSKSGSTMETAIALRSLRWELERRYGTREANRRIYAVTDPCKGALRQMAEEEGWESFSIPAGVRSRYSLLSPAGLLPMAVAGIDITAILAGAAEAKECYDLRSFENPVWLYAGVRNLLYRRGKQIELLQSWEPDFFLFGKWWQHLFSESEGKKGKGLFPVNGTLSTELYTLGQMLQEGERNLFETVIRFDPPQRRMTVGAEWKNLDGLNYLEGKTLDQVEAQSCQAVISAHADGGVPVITLDCGTLDAKKVGELIYFMELSCGLSGYLLGVNPFNQPGVEVYKRNVFRLLGRPGYEL